MGRKAPISFGLRKYIEKHCSGPSECTTKQGEMQERLHCS